MNNQDQNRLLKLSLQRALLGNITPNIRAIIAKIIESHIELLFYYDGDIKDEDRENASIIETEVIADFDPEYSISTEVEQLDFPYEIKNEDGILIFLRKEI